MNALGFSCRTCLTEAVRRLERVRLLTFINLEALYEEVLEYGCRNNYYRVLPLLAVPAVCRLAPFVRVQNLGVSKYTSIHDAII